MKHSEKTLERTLNAKVEMLGGWSIKLLPFQLAGLPDRLCLFPGGRVAFVELKSSNEKIRPLQGHVHKKLRKLGFSVSVIDRPDQIIELLRNYA